MGIDIVESVRHSELYAARDANEGWKQLRIEMNSDFPQAAWLVLELQLLQPALYAGESLGQRTLHPQDIRGSAWFDDITVAQVPRVRLATQVPATSSGPTMRGLLDVSLSDSFTQDLVAQLIIRDADEKIVFQRSGALEMTADPKTPAQKHSIIRLPELRPGWYQAALSMTSQGKLLGTQALDLILLPEGLPATAADPRFGIDRDIAADRGVERAAQNVAALVGGAGEAGGLELVGGRRADRPGRFRYIA